MIVAVDFGPDVILFELLIQLLFTMQKKFDNISVICFFELLLCRQAVVAVVDRFFVARNLH